MSNPMVRRIAIIPARAGSKRVPGKNIRDFCGKPMIAHILETARESGLFETIHVSTESEAVRGVVSGLGFAPDFARPAELADDVTPLVPVLRWTVGEYQRRGRDFDQAWLLMACAPLIRPEHLQAMARRFAELGRNCQALVAVQPFASPIQRGYFLGQDHRLLPVQPECVTARSQDLVPAYHDAGTVDVYDARFLLSEREADWSGRCHGYVLPRHAAVDIDNEDDWRLAEMIFRGQSGR